MATIEQTEQKWGTGGDNPPTGGSAIAAAPTHYTNPLFVNIEGTSISVGADLAMANATIKELESIIRDLVELQITDEGEGQTCTYCRVEQPDLDEGYGWIEAVENHLPTCPWRRGKELGK